MLQERPQSATIDLEELLSHAHISRDLLVGARALMINERKPIDVGTMATLVAEACAHLDSLVGAVDNMAAAQAEPRRAEQAHRDAQARIHAASVGVAR